MNKYRPRFARIFRAGEWWDHKLVPLLAIFYGTAWLGHRSIASLSLGIFLLLAAIVPGAIYVSVINDLSDRGDDAAAGKPNRMIGRPMAQSASFVLLPLAAGLAFLLLWRDRPPLMLAYLGAWISFSLYSLPPVRLKIRGLAGILADAAGAHLFPSLVSLLVATYAAGTTVDPVWAIAVAFWALAYGLRGIIWHQLADAAHDRRAGVRTFAERLSPRRAASFAVRIAFPVELVALGAMLWRLATPLPLVGLAAYGLLLYMRVRVTDERAVIVMPRARRWAMVLQEYYELFLPLSILATSAWFYPLDLVLAAAHLLLFHRRAVGMLRQMRGLSMVLAARRQG